MEQRVLYAWHGTACSEALLTENLLCILLSPDGWQLHCIRHVANTKALELTRICCSLFVCAQIEPACHLEQLGSSSVGTKHRASITIHIMLSVRAVCAASCLQGEFVIGAVRPVQSSQYQKNPASNHDKSTKLQRLGSYALTFTSYHE